MVNIDPNREAELAHELEELKVQVDAQVKSLHALRNQMSVIALRLLAIRTGSSVEHDVSAKTLLKIAAIEVEIAEQWIILDNTPVSDRIGHHRIRNTIQKLIARVYLIKRGLSDPDDKT